MKCLKDTARDLVVIRPGRANDLPFIYATWLRGIYYGNETFRQIKPSVFYEKYQHVIKCITFEKECFVDLAVLEQDTDVIIGYSIHNRNALHWVYVKSAWRRAGIASMLVPKIIDTCTHLTRIGMKLKPENWDFDPFL